MIEGLSRVIKEVGGLILNWRDSGILEGNWEGTQFKAKADNLAHHELEKRLKEIEPLLPVVSEEDLGSLKEKRPERYWLIDPIDGTASFVNGFPGFVTQVALMENDRPICSAIFAPALNELYTAENGKGAFLNGKRLMLKPKKELEAIIDNYPEPRGIAKQAFDNLGFKRYVECGSIGLKICKVADGTADLFIKDVIVRDWDLAAPELVLEEAGGTLTDIEGKSIEYSGSYEHVGLIAAREKDINSMIANWRSNLIKGLKT